MSTPIRLLLLSEPADEVEARAFISTLARVLPGATLDHFAPSFSFASVPGWLLQESRARVDAADAVLCLVGATSSASAWATWAITAALDVSKRVACVRLHSNPARDVAPPIATSRRVLIMGAQPAAVAAYLVDGKIPAERPRKIEPALDAPLLSRFGQRP